MTTEKEFKNQFAQLLEEYPVNLLEYWQIPGQPDGEWQNKPHRPYFDVLRKLYHARLEINRLKSIVGEPLIDEITGLKEK